MNIEKVKLKDGSEHPLGGSWNNLTDKPLHTVQTVLFSDAAQSFSYVSNYGSYIYETNDASLLKKWYTSWKKAIVTIDGVQYLPKKQTADGENYLGDALRLQTGSVVTGEPYAIGVTNGYFIFALFVDSVPEDTIATVEHTISITLENEIIQDDYLPSIPEFDLTAMGLPEIPMDGTLVSVSCDTTKLISALEKGSVKLTSNVKFSDTITQSYTCIASAGFVGNEYNCTMCGVMGGAPMMISIAVTSSKISAYITALAVPTTTTTETGTT